MENQESLQTVEDLWNQELAPQEVSLEQMDDMIQETLEKREAYDKLKKESGDAYREYQEAQKKVLLALKAAGKKSYKVDGLGTFSIVQKQVVTVPKDIESKRELFEWIDKTYGKDLLDSMLSINHNSLNSFYNQEFEKAEDKALFDIPGIDAPTIQEEARFTKARKK